MKTKIKKTVIVLSLLFAVMALPNLASAQYREIERECRDPKPPSAPIDGGISLLVIAGVGYGLKKAKERNKSII